MSINFTAKNVKLTGALKAFTERNLKSIEKISGDIIDAEIIVSEEKLGFKVEMSVKTKLHSYHVEDKNAILKQALRSTLNTLKTQTRKNKEKLKNEKRRVKSKKGIFKAFSRGEAVEAASTVVLPGESETPLPGKITVSHNYSGKPLSIEEALFFLKESGENAYMFTNIETNKMSVLFYDDGKNISIIEAG